MSFKKCLGVILLVVVIVTQTEGCPQETFACSSGKCIKREWFCDSGNDCGDNSDERFCNYDTQNGCPHEWTACSNQRRCIPSKWVCDGRTDCPDGSDEIRCDNDVTQIPGVLDAKHNLTNWFRNLRKTAFTTDRWGPQINRIAVVLHLAEDRLSKRILGSLKREEISYELTIQVLDQLFRNEKLQNQDLALYINAMLAVCIDPRDFYGVDLMKDLRNRVDSSNYTNPFEILVLCNAGDDMKSADVNRVINAYNAQLRPFWTDIQAISAMALTCLSSRPTVGVDKRILEGMFKDLKRKQFRNGTVDNLKSTALVVQALFTNQTYKVDFDLASAIQSLLESQKPDGSFGSLLNSYYILPVLSYKSLLNVNNSHCSKSLETEEEALKKYLEGNGARFKVQYSVFVGKQAELIRSWNLKLHANNSFYDVIETISRLDNRHKVEYSIVAGKPYVSALLNLEDDAEKGIYWFTYVRSVTSKDEPKLLEDSPVDVLIQANQELILWYRPGIWVGDTLKPETEKSVF